MLGGGFDPSKMQQMMKQMGIDADSIDATEVVIRTDDTEYVFDGPDVTKMDAQGEEIYQVIGSPETRKAGDTATTQDEGIPESDVDMVVERTGVSSDDARAALEANDGDLAAAVAELE